MKNNLQSFSKPLMIGGNGHGMRALTVTGDSLLMFHTDEVVSLWSLSGSEISQYSQSYSAALLSRDQDNKLLLFLARNDIQVICPTEPECLDKMSGHQGAVTALAA